MGNLKNKEVIWAIDYSTNLSYNDLATPTYPNGHPRGSNSGHLLYLMTYDQVNTAVLIRDINNGRPFNRYMPTLSYLNMFDDANDSRYDGSFQTVWYANKAATGFAIGDTINHYAGLITQVTNVGGGGQIISLAIVNPGSLISGQLTGANPGGITSTSGGGVPGSFNVLWGVTTIGVTNPGTGYGAPPTVVVSPGGDIQAAGTAVLGASSAGNPTVPGFFQQRLVLAGPVSSPQQFNISQPGAYYNYNISNPIEPDNAIAGTLVSGQLNTIQSMIAQPQGLIMLSDKQAWLINGGSAGSPISAVQINANSQAYNGASFPPPIVANDNILYVQSKGSIVRDLVFNFYTAVYTGTDISVLSSHLFYGFNILEWAWAEEPFKVVWAVRNDGVMLTLTFLKEQDLIAWAHSDTQGAFKSVASVTETVPAGAVDAVYTIVQRTINGLTVQYVERMTELYYPLGLTDAWCVDAGLQYNGSSVLTFTGAQHLAGAIVTGLATDNLGNVTVITPFAMPVNGTFTLPAPASPATGFTRVTIGLDYLPQLKTLQLDTGEPTIQGKEKKITAVTVRVNETLGLSIGQTFDLCGTETLNLSEIVDAILKVTGRRRIKLPLPFALANIQAAGAEFVFNHLLGKAPPLNRDQVTMLRTDNASLICFRQRIA